MARHFAIFLTYDCGNHWEPQIRESPESLLGEAIFAASNSSLATSALSQRFFVTGGSAGSRLLMFWTGVDDTDTPDPIEVLPGAKPFHPFKRGWNIANLPVSQPAESTGAFSLGTKEWPLLVVGGNFRKPDQTTDTGWYMGPYNPSLRTNWHAAQTPPNGYRSAVAYDPAMKTWITVGPNGTDISTDDGRNWRALNPNPQAGDAPDADRNWNALSLPFVVARTAASPSSDLLLYPRRSHDRKPERGILRTRKMPQSPNRPELKR